MFLGGKLNAEKESCKLIIMYYYFNTIHSGRVVDSRHGYYNFTKFHQNQMKKKKSFNYRPFNGSVVR